jgi:excisionase family DNA binding protein
MEDNLAIIRRANMESYKMMNAQREEILSSEEAAAYLRITVASLYRRKTIPRIKMGRLLRYRASDLDRYLDSCASQCQEEIDDDKEDTENEPSKIHNMRTK